MKLGFDMQEENKVESSADYPYLKFESERIKAIRRKCQKPLVEEEPFARFFLRRISVYFTLVLLKIGIHPNIISFFSILFFLLSGALLVIANPIAFLLAFCFYVLGYLCDCVDGEIARLKGIASKKKESFWITLSDPIRFLLL